jgi:hypothetical protein
MFGFDVAIFFWSSALGLTSRLVVAWEPDGVHLPTLNAGRIVTNTSWARIFIISDLISHAFPELRADFQIRVLAI